MASLPPLRTVQTATPSISTTGSLKSSGVVPTTKGVLVTAAGPQTLPSKSLAISRFPKIAQDVFQTLIQLGLLEEAQIQQLHTQLGLHVQQLQTRERVTEALLNAQLLTSYQCEQVLAGRTNALVYGSYHVLERLNGGTVGAVLRAEHRSLKRQVAIKLLPVDDTQNSTVVDRFLTEMHLLARLDHPHVVRVYDAGWLPPFEAGGSQTVYAALELVVGGDLEQFVYAHGRVPTALACELGRQMAVGLSAAHSQGFFHRDFKPSNVLLTDDRTIKITDFGLARHFSSVITKTGCVIGSIEFMSPEQANDPTTIAGPADVYGLGATLFWMLTGELPYPQANSLSEAIANIRQAEPRRARTIYPGIPEAVDLFLARMLHRNPAVRPSAAEAGEFLSQYAAASSHPLAANAATHAVAMTDLKNALHQQQTVARDASLAVLTTMAKLTELRGESPGRHRRHQEYVRTLGQRIAKNPAWSAFLDSVYLDEVVRCVPCRNVGLLGLPESLTLKTGALSEAEALEYQRHTTIGTELLQQLAKQHGDSLTFLRSARAVIRHHHENWNGTGYPDRLAKQEIPHAARLVAVAEAYDTLRRPYGDEPGLNHLEAIDGILDQGNILFDPTVLEALVECQTQFEMIFATIAD